jgi:hypothetical protein
MEIAKTMPHRYDNFNNQFKGFDKKRIIHEEMPKTLLLRFNF